MRHPHPLTPFPCVILYLKSYTIKLCSRRFLGLRVFGFRGSSSTPQSKTLPTHLLLCRHLVLLLRNIMFVIRCFARFAVGLWLQVTVFNDRVAFPVLLVSFQDFQMIHICTQNHHLFLSQIVRFPNGLDCLLKPGRKRRWLGSKLTFDLFGLSLRQTEFLHGFMLSIYI